MTWLAARALGAGAGRRVLRRDRRLRAGGAWPSWAPRPAWSTGRPGCAPPASDDLLAACLRVGLVPVVAASVLAGRGAVVGVPARSADLADRDHPAEFDRALRALAALPAAGRALDALLAATRGFRAMRPTVLLDRLMRPRPAARRLARSLAIMVTADHRSADRSFALAWAAPYLPGRRPRRASRSAGIRPAPRSGGTRRRGEGERQLSAATFWRFTGPRAVASVAQTGAAAGRRAAGRRARRAARRPPSTRSPAGSSSLGQFANQGISQSVQPRLAEVLAVGDRARPRPALPDRDRAGWCC